MRERSPESIAALLRRNYLEYGISFYFFTDDNFARKKLWRETFEAIIKLRQEGIKVSFMMQVDLARKPKDFVELAAKAGCTQVFIGMESVNPENLKAEGKKQNNVAEYRKIIQEWHNAGVVVHTGYIIGLPWDSTEQVPKDIRFLMEEVGPDQASFFMLTPLPGSHDHREMRRRGEWMDPDFNKRDSFHATIKHPRMTAEEWTHAYEKAWESFYSKENMIKVLSRWSDQPKAYWNLMCRADRKTTPDGRRILPFEGPQDSSWWICRRPLAGPRLETRQGNHVPLHRLGQVCKRNGRGMAPDQKEKRHRRTLDGTAAKTSG
jgi:radical SAM superfamily enzyme YgiQ (UPF0313 family)